jgi:hypothetical protein
MDRRDFLKKGAVAGAAGAATLTSGSCAFLPQFLHAEKWPAFLPSMDRYLLLVDGGLAKIDRGGILVGFAGGGQHPPEKETLAVKSLKTLYMTGMFGDLPEKGQLHPGMQNRMWKAMPEMDEAVNGTISHIESLDGHEKAELHKLLKRRTSPVMDIGNALDAEAEQCSVSAERRRQMRKMFSYMAMRLAHQSPDLLFDELVKKSKKMASLGGRIEDVEKIAAARVGKQELHRRKLYYSALADEWRQTCGFDPDVPGNKALLGGGIVMGLGAVILIGGGLALATGAFAGAILMTVGGVLLLAGMITMIAGAVIRYRYHYL